MSGRNHIFLFAKHRGADGSSAIETRRSRSPVIERFFYRLQAFMVGIVFAKMARPKHRSQTLMFSKNAVICQRDGQLCFMFRVGDMRKKSQLIGATISTRFIRSRMTQEGETLAPHISQLKVSLLKKKILKIKIT